MLHSITIIMEKGEKIGSYDTLKSIGKYNWVYPTPKTPNDSKVNWVCRN